MLDFKERHDPLPPNANSFRIDTGTLAGLRDRALLSVMLYSFARSTRCWGCGGRTTSGSGPGLLRLHEKGGKHAAPVVVPVRRRASLGLDNGADVNFGARRGTRREGLPRPRGGDIELGGRAVRCTASNGRGLDAIVAGPPADGEEQGASVPAQRGLGSPAKQAQKARRGGHRRRGARRRSAFWWSWTSGRYATRVAFLARRAGKSGC